MKKSVLLFVGLLLTAVSAFAQPAKPQVAFSSWGEGEFYLYNVEAGMFLTNGNAWEARATMVTGGNNNNIINYDKFMAGQGDVDAIKWEIKAADDSRGLTGDGNYCYIIHNTKNASYNLTVTTAKEGWVDAGPGRPETEYEGWYIASKDDAAKTFKLSYIRKNAKKDGEGQVIENEYEYEPMTGTFCVSKLGEGNFDTFYDETGINDTWAVVSVAEYNNVIDGFKLYYAGERLKTMIADAKALGINADFSAYETTLNNPESTLKDLQDAFNKLKPAVEFGKVIVEAKQLDANRWGKFEAIFADPESTNAIFETNTKLIRALMDLKTSLDEGKTLDADHDYTKAEGLYASDESAQADIEAETKRVKAFISLKKALDKATADYPSLDFSEVKATYDESESTVDNLAAAEAKIAEQTAQYDLEHASVEKPGDITSQLTNVDGKSATDWKQVFTGEGNVGGFACNTWSVEANNGADGTNMTTNFLQSHVGKGSILSDQKIYREPFKVTPGAYKITGNIRIYNESGAEYMKGAYLFANINRNSLFANEDEAQTNAIEGAKYNTYNNMLNYWKDGFETYTIVPEDGTLSFGLLVEDPNYNWIAAKDFHVYYMGDTYEAFEYVRNNSEMFVQPYPEETIAMKQLLNDFNNAAKNYGEATNAKDIKDAVQAIVALADSLQANANAYQAYYDKVIEFREGDFDLVGDDADILFDYIDTGYEEFGPESDEAIAYGFANGFAEFILTDRSLTTEQIIAELAFLNQLYENAVRNSLTNGSDLTDLIKNADFASNNWKDSNGNGWTETHTNDSNARWATNVAVSEKCAEAYDAAAFDIYQELKDLPDGLYEISVQGFYRYGRDTAFKDYLEKNSDYVKEGGSPCYIYMNNMSTPFKNVFDEENKGKEFYGSTNYGTYTYGEGDGAITEYYPNGMSSAAVAFNAGMYTQKAYGLVQEGDVMRIGVKGNSSQLGDSWVIFDNFKLTYRAKDPTAIMEVLKMKREELKNLIAEARNNNNITEPVYKDANDIANTTIDDNFSNDAKYEILIETNDAIVASRKNIEKVEAYKAIYTKYDEAADALELVDPSCEDAIWDDIDNIDDEAEGYVDLNTDELADLTTRMEQLTTDILAKVEEIKVANKVKDMASATDEQPYDATSFIKNPDMEEAADSKTMPGWEFWIAHWSQKEGKTDEDKANGPVKGSDGISGRSLEAWSGTVGADLDFHAFQTVNDLPAGKYVLTAKAANASNGVTADENLWNNPETAAAGRVYFYTLISDGENERAVSIPVEPNIGSATAANTYELTFTLAEGEEATIGFQTVGTVPFRWFMCDDFGLMYYGTQSSKTDSTDEGDVVAIEEVEEIAAGKTIAGIYTASGVQIETLQPGVNIVKYTDGTSRKIFK